jgi:alpha-beta hydrolase superfamily lysophospholipase
MGEYTGGAMKSHIFSTGTVATLAFSATVVGATVVGATVITYGATGGEGHAGSAAPQQRSNVIQAATHPRIDSVAFVSGAITLRGVMHLPAGAPPYPAVFFLHGGGAQYLNNEPTDFARMLVAQGIAALVYDKRGTGNSGGDFSSSTFADFVADGQAAYRYLASRPDIRADRVGVLGFSQGGRLAPIVASTLPLAAAISVSGPAVPAAEQRLFAMRNAMLQQGQPQETVDRALTLWRAQFDAITNGTPLAALDETIAASRVPRGLLPPLSSQFVTNPILNSFRFNGDSLTRTLRVPFLSLLGSADAIVPVEPTVSTLRTLLGPDRPGSFEIVVLDGATHALDFPPGTRHPEYVPRVMNWMTRFLKAP